MDQLQRWFGPLDAALNVGPGAAGVGPGPAETSLLLDMGKLAAEAAPQRMYALLTAFAVGRALGRAEQEDCAVDPVAFLQAALAHVQSLAVAPPANEAVTGV